MKLAAVFLFYAFVAGVSARVTRTTVDGQKCMIPFKKDGKLHYDCPLADRYSYGSGYRWCPTDKSQKKFAFCAAPEISTEKKHKCVFPFMYGGKIYDRCTTDADTKPWCIYDKNGNWDYCDYCASSPCQNGGACVQIPDRQDYSCKCAQGFKGENCEIKITTVPPSTTAAASTGTCPAGFTKLTPGWCVKIFKGATRDQDWGKWYCARQATGGRLAEPRTTAKFDAFKAHIRTLYGSGYTTAMVFIGAERPSSSNSLTDIRWLSDNTPLSMSKTMWSSHDPNSTSQDCVRFGTALKLWDTSCTVKIHVACEAPAQ